MADNKNNEENQHKEQPIIIKKIKKGGHGHHGGAWKVAYADFVTAMMAFFIVMWILGQSEEVKQNVQEYFENPFNYDMFTGERKTNTPVQLNIFEGTTGKSVKGEDKANNSEAKNAGEDKTVIISFNGGEKDSVVNELLYKAINDSISAAKKVEEIGNELEKKFKDLVSKKPEFDEILSSIKIEVSKEGTRIELIETSESLFFQVGSTKLTKEAMEVLKTIARELGKYPNNIEIEGHTDSRAYPSKSYSNWELSADRANSARKVLETGGLWEDQISRITGFADNNLRNPENPFDVTNRRISILVKQLSATQFLRNMQESSSEE